MSTRRKKPTRSPGARPSPTREARVERSSGASAAVSTPPGVLIERYFSYDLGSSDDDTVSEPLVLEVWTTQRDRVIDLWLDAEHFLRTAATLLLGSTDELRQQIWSLVNRQGGEHLIRFVRDLLVANGHAVPATYSQALNDLCRLRNLFAHQVSRPPHGYEPDGLLFLQRKDFGKGQYVHIPFAEIEKAVDNADPVLKWLHEALPAVGSVSVDVDDALIEGLAQLHGSLGASTSAQDDKAR